MPEFNMETPEQEPGHLSLGKLMDGYLQTVEHFFISQFAYDV